MMGRRGSGSNGTLPLAPHLLQTIAYRLGCSVDMRLAFPLDLEIVEFAGLQYHSALTVA